MLCEVKEGEKKSALPLIVVVFIKQSLFDITTTHLVLLCVICHARLDFKSRSYFRGYNYVNILENYHPRFVVLVNECQA